MISSVCRGTQFTVLSNIYFLMIWRTSPQRLAFIVPLHTSSLNSIIPQGGGTSPRYYTRLPPEVEVGRRPPGGIGGGVQGGAMGPQ